MSNQTLVVLVIIVLFLVLDFVYVSPRNVQKRVRVQVTYLRFISGLPIFLIPFFGLTAILMIFSYAVKLWYMGQPEMIFWDRKELEVMEAQIMEGESKSKAYISAIRMMIYG